VNLIPGVFGLQSSIQVFGPQLEIISIDTDLISTFTFELFDSIKLKTLARYNNDFSLDFTRKGIKHVRYGVDRGVEGIIGFAKGLLALPKSHRPTLVYLPPRPELHSSEEVRLCREGGMEVAFEVDSREEDGHELNRDFGVDHVFWTDFRRRMRAKNGNDKRREERGFSWLPEDL